MKIFKKLLFILSIAILVASCSSSGKTSTLELKDGETNIRIISTSDIHGKFLPYDYAQDKPSKSGSLAQVATAIKEQRTPNTIVIGLGDDIQGNLVELFNSEDSSVKSPIAIGKNEIGYDYWVPGNHEFNFGMGVLKNYISQLNATVLCANVYDENGERIGEPYVIKNVDGVKFAIIGITSPNITRWDGVNLAKCKVTNPINEIKSILAEIEGQYDILVVASHMGLKSEYEVVGSGAEDIIAAFPNIDIFLTSHEHSSIADKFIGSTIVSQNLNEGQTIAEIDVKVNAKDGKVESKNFSGKSIKMANYKEDEKLLSLFAEYDKLAKEDSNKVIGYLVNGPLSPADEIPGITTAKIQETALTNLINDVQLYYSGAQVSAAALFKDSANWQTGEIKKKSLADVYPFANTLYKVSISGKSLKKYMEWSVAYYNQYKYGDLTISFNPDRRGYLYDIFGGVYYDIDISKPLGYRIKNLRLANGEEIKDDRYYTLAVNNYRLSSQLLSTTGGVFTEESELPKILEVDIRSELGGIREMIGEYVKEKSVDGKFTAPAPRGRWKIIGNNWSLYDHNKVVKAVEDGKLSIHNSEDGRYTNIKSITKNDLKAVK